MVISDITIESSTIPYKKICIVLYTAKFLFEYYLKLRQYKRLCNGHLPNELKEMGVELDKYAESKKYSSAKMKFSLFSNLFDFILELILLIINFNGYIWEISRSIIGIINLNSNNEYYVLFIFLLLEQIRQTLISIPFSLYQHFILEEKYGFNKQTIGTFIKDTIKSFILQMIFIPLVIDVILLAIAYGGKHFYIIVEIVCVILFFFFMWLYPNVIAPLFNKFSDLEDGPVKEKINKLAERINYPLKKIYVIDASARTDHSNAYLYGLGNNKRIVLYDTLIEKLSPEEIESIVGHELGHWKHSHTIKMASVALIQMFGMFYLFSYFVNNNELLVSFGFKSSAVFIGLMLFFNMFSPFNYIIEIFTLRMSRTFEYQADEFSFSIGYGPQLQTSLKKLHEKNLSDMDPDPIYSQFTYSHPTLIERCRALNNLMKDKKNI